MEGRGRGGGHGSVSQELTLRNIAVWVTVRDKGMGGGSGVVEMRTRAKWEYCSESAGLSHR